MLQRIKTPKDLKKIPDSKLPELCQEIRRFILKNISKTGGHLASNLGVVELTIALHKHLDCPKDQIIWDVGHQSYVHKILTGRQKKFRQLRQLGGISGFPKREESPYDVFGTGHASTSISAAMGLAEARKKNKQKTPRIVAVIGDGAFTGGIALEAINQIGYLQTPVTIVLNDNRMSIAPNVGALSRYTKRIEETQVYKRAKKAIYLLSRDKTSKTKKNLINLQTLKRAFKEVGTPGLLFEKLGINYLGPVDGHNISRIIEALKRARKINGPVLIHVRTKKGMGYKFAENQADKYHGVLPFSLKTGACLYSSDPISFSQSFGQKLLQLGRKNKKIIAITCAMPDGTGLNHFANELPEQFYDTGITEQHAVTFAAGLAAAGKKPVVAIYSSFLQRSCDQIIHDVCLQNLPVIFAIDRAGLAGEDGPTHHGVFDISLLRPIPNLIIMAPKDNPELKAMLELALKLNRPVAIRYPRGSGQSLKLPVWCVPQKTALKKGKSQIINTGKDTVIISVGNQLCRAITLGRRRKVKPSIINARFIKPIDPEIIAFIKKTGQATIIEENAITGGFGSAVLEQLAKKNINARVKLMGIGDQFVEQGTVNELQKKYLK
ncbi:MAG: 1-deoxy-D-xylulose-5-phosphate synthase [Patescibacteria group bacterium]|nr:1-deoxy-D-xylulose-5-phosphate synthase [Patescibacteria group bacterium]